MQVKDYDVERSIKVMLQIKEKYELEIEDDDVSLGIKNFMNQSGINLHSFTVRKKRIFEKLFKPNLFKRILQEAKLPMLIFPS